MFVQASKFVIAHAGCKADDVMQLVKLIRKRRGMRLDPTGLLWVEWKGYQGGPMGAVRNVLLQLQS